MSGLKILLPAILASLCVVGVSVGAGIDPRYDYEEADYILTVHLYRTTDPEIIEQAHRGDFLKMSDDEILALIESDENVEVVKKVLRMIYGQCRYDTLTKLQYAVPDSDGHYKLVTSGSKQGIFADITYGISDSSPDLLELTGICTICECYGRDVFSPLPELDAGKPRGYYSGGLKATGYPALVPIGKSKVVSQYSTGKEAGQFDETVVCALLIEKAQDWKGDLSEILNHTNAWIVYDPDPPASGLRPELLIKREKKEESAQ